MIILKHKTSLLLVSIIILVTAWNFTGSGAAGANLSENINVVEKIEKAESYLEEFAAETPAPGFSVVICSTEQIIYSQGFGREDVRTQKMMRDDTMVAIGSLTKSFTALAVMQLAEEGKLALDDPVVEYLAEFRTLDKEKSREITIRHLLSNSSGLPSVDHSLYTGDEDSRQILEKLSARNLLFEPGSHFSYSNEGFVLAGLIIEEISEQPYADYIEENILKPLEMEDSTTDIAEIDDLEAIAGHNPGVKEALPAEPVTNSALLASGSEFRSTALDLGNYLLLLLNEGSYEGSQLLSADNTARLFEAETTFSAEDEGIRTDDGQAGYGLGWSSGQVKERLLIMHAGKGATQSSLAILDPEENIGLALLFNVESLDQYRYTSKYELGLNILRIFDGEEPEKIYKIEDDPTYNNYQLNRELEPYTGTYISSDASNIVEVYKYDEGLRAEQQVRTGVIEYKLDFASPTTVIFRNFAGSRQADFQLTTEGEVTGLSGELENLTRVSREQDLDFQRKYEKLQLEEGLTVEVPRDFRLKDSNSKHIFENGESKLIVERGASGTADNNGYAHFINQIKGEREILLAGEKNQEMIASRLCYQQSFVIKEKEEKKQLLLGYAKQGGRFFAAAVECPYGKGTEMAGEVLLPLFLYTEF